MCSSISHVFEFACLLIWTSLNYGRISNNVFFSFPLLILLWIEVFHTLLGNTWYVNWTFEPPSSWWVMDFPCSLCTALLLVVQDLKHFVSFQSCKSFKQWMTDSIIEPHMFCRNNKNKKSWQQHRLIKSEVEQRWFEGNYRGNTNIWGGRGSDCWYFYALLVEVC